MKNILFKEWLLDKPNIYSESTRRECFDDMLIIIQDWIQQTNDLQYVNLQENFPIHFYYFMYCFPEYPLPEIDETVYCSSKYSYDVSELYVHCKDILSKYGFSISKFNSNNLFTFLFNYLYVIDDNDTEEEEELDLIDEY
jgi:hypothetical protein